MTYSKDMLRAALRTPRTVLGAFTLEAERLCEVLGVDGGKPTVEIACETMRRAIDQLASDGPTDAVIDAVERAMDVMRRAVES